jgi:predicted metal-dependent HD superfamily phosphohydrolase
MDLLAAWRQALGPSPEVFAAGRDLVGRYAEPHRRYHDSRHLADVLRALDTVSEGADVPAAVVLAAYFHDAVYEGTGADEQRSADLAAAVLRSVGRPDAEVDEVVRLVLLTVTHDPADGDVPGSLLCDADLAVLGAAPERYRQYAADVREEYGHVDDADFRRGRAAVLRVLLDQPELFRTPVGRRRWELPARRNLQQELARLGAAPRP